ncbi:SPOR domain-containing protein [Desulfuromonas acetoxidans]|uniref:Sporulation related n=1 Tax=Desulfuromonas acetoxidans (strain DSM 684 / 11070) TaxID=281689 RepID=Q1JY19_DESA6|nr:SPOR domain-containing protein [Desulfuromonas acetoxidans]EAT15177.1 Sporulation related [Desulfuromonas acetoxidans DSM 684]MBF0644004.1 SPOR domain-containing protein [Desulfuromonas acetoxidans]NVD23242.1 SPOR domain-containing protein [Desulfuromonas acetoxidans]NVE15517.1 SPOR domain-containing protein [Desulfuromonas acetoxidans]
MSQVDYSRREPKANGRRFITVLVLVVVLCLVSFSLGLMVGKSGKPVVETTQIQTVPLPPQPRTVAPQAQPAPSSEQSAMAEVGDEKASQVTEQPASNDPLRELLPPVEQMPLGSGINHGAEQTAAEQATAAAEPITATAPVKVPLPAKPVVTAPVVEKPQAATTVVTTATGYVVQVASFKHRQDAETMSSKLGKDFPVVVRQADLGEKGLWYRVLVGPVATKAEAETLKQDLKKKASTDGFIKKFSA